MALKVIFAPNQDSITVTGLYQWDYGQQLEIEAEGLPTVVEVHFSCTNMTEAIVRTCVIDEVSGVYTVSIPDDCLEQSTPITAWIYDFSVTQGKTVKVITLPVIARTRPSVTREVSLDDEDQLATLITDLNEAVEKLKNGEIKVKSAETADTADTVTDFTGVVESAKFATTSELAQKDIQANVIHTTYFKQSKRPLVMSATKGTKLSQNSYDAQTDTRLRLFKLPIQKSLDDFMAIGFSFVYTDENGYSYNLEAHGVKATYQKETRVPTIENAYSADVVCNIVSSKYLDSITNPSIDVFGSITVELTLKPSNEVYIRFLTSNVCAAFGSGDFNRIGFISLKYACVLNDVFVYVL